MVQMEKEANQELSLDEMPPIPEMSWRRGLSPESAPQSPGVNRLD